MVETRVSPLDSVLECLENNFDARVEELVTLSRIPSVSAAGYPRETVVCSAAILFEELGITARG